MGSEMCIRDSAQLQAVRLIHPFFIDAYFTTAQDAINMALGHTFQVFAQEVIDTLIATAFVNFSPRYRFFA